MKVDLCMISKEPGGDLVLRSSRLLPDQKMWVKKTYWDQEFEPRAFVILYGQSLVHKGTASGQGKFSALSQEKRFCRIIEKKLYFGDPITLDILL